MIKRFMTWFTNWLNDFEPDEGVYGMRIDSEISKTDSNFINYSGSVPNFYIRVEDKEKTDQWVHAFLHQPIWYDIKELKPKWAWNGHM